MQIGKPKIKFLGGLFFKYLTQLRYAPFVIIQIVVGLEKFL